MILFCTGTTQFPFTRLAQVVKTYSHNHSKTEIIFQAGAVPLSLQFPSNVTVASLFSHSEMLSHYQRARLVVTAGGEASLFELLQHCQYQPILFPRDPRYGEHVDTQQLKVAQAAAKKGWCQVAYTGLSLKRMIESATSQPQRNTYRLSQPNQKLLEQLHRLTHV